MSQREIVLDLERLTLRDIQYASEDDRKQVWTTLSPADFQSDTHGRIYAAWRGLAQDGEPLDYTHLMARLAGGSPGGLETCGGTAGVLSALMPNLLDPLDPYHGFMRHSLPALARALKKLGAQRQVSRIGRSIQENPERLVTLLPELQALEQANGKPAESWSAAAYSEADFASREYPKPVNLLGDGLLAKGDLGMLYGKPKLGKSWLALMLARAVATGSPWLGIAGPENPVTVAFVSLEIKARRLQSRLAMLRGDESASDNLFLLARPDLKGPVDFLEDGCYRQAVDFCGGKDLAIFDATSRTHTADENDGQRMAELLARCDRLGQETGCAVLLIHHERKSDPKANGNEDDLDALRGSSRFLSDPTLLMRLKRKGGLLQLVCSGANNGPEFDPVWLAQGKHGPPVQIEAPAEKAERNRSAVMDALAARGSASVEELAHDTGLAGRTIREHLTIGGAVKIGGTRGARYKHLASGGLEIVAPPDNRNSLFPKDDA